MYSFVSLIAQAAEPPSLTFKPASVLHTISNIDWASAQPLRDGPSMSYPSILLVDDDPALRAELSDFLAFHLPVVTMDVIESPRIALAWITARPYHALITDLCMGPFTGLELLRGAKAIRPEMPVIVLPDRLDVSIRSHVFRLGVYDMLPREENAHELLGVLKAALELRDLSRSVTDKHLLLHRLQK